MILSCTCENEYQDKRYGKSKRVMNKIKSPDNKTYRCTVCLKERQG